MQHQVSFLVSENWSLGHHVLLLFFFFIQLEKGYHLVNNMHSLLEKKTIELSQTGDEAMRSILQL